MKSSSEKESANLKEMMLVYLALWNILKNHNRIYKWKYGKLTNYILFPPFSKFWIKGYLECDCMVRYINCFGTENVSNVEDVPPCSGINSNLYQHQFSFSKWQMSDVLNLIGQNHIIKKTKIVVNRRLSQKKDSMIYFMNIYELVELLNQLADGFISSRNNSSDSRCPFFLSWTNSKTLNRENHHAQ